MCWIRHVLDPPCAGSAIMPVPVTLFHYIVGISLQGISLQGPTL